MSDFRIRYGLALGPLGSAGATSANNLLPPQDATPDVSLGSFFVTNNTSAVTYTYFDWVGPGGSTDPAYVNGKIISILFQDNLTTVQNANQIFLNGTGGAMNSGQVLTLVQYNSAWREISSTEVAGGREKVKTVTVAGAALAPNVAGAEVLIVNNTAASTLVGLSGGVVGQIVHLMKAFATAGTALTLQSAANFTLAGTTAFIINDSAIATFVNDGTRFRQVGGPAVP